MQGKERKILAEARINRLVSGTKTSCGLAFATNSAGSHQADTERYPKNSQRCRFGSVNLRGRSETSFESGLGTDPGDLKIS